MTNFFKKKNRESLFTFSLHFTQNFLKNIFFIFCLHFRFPSSILTNFFSLLEACANSIVQASSDSLDQDTYGVLEQELENCHKLLELAVDGAFGSYSELLELESDSKWTLYTKVLIMKTMDARKFHAEIVAGFETLCHIGNVQF